MAVEVRIRAKDRADARLAITVAKVKIPAKAKADARRPRTAAKVRMVAPQVAKFRDQSVCYESDLAFFIELSVEYFHRKLFVGRYGKSPRILLEYHGEGPVDRRKRLAHRAGHCSKG